MNNMITRRQREKAGTRWERRNQDLRCDGGEGAAVGGGGSLAGDGNASGGGGTE